MDTILSGAPEQLRPFVSDGRITVMPAKRAPRLLLLDQVAQAFEPGRRYDEAIVNGVLKTVTDDHAALRRYLVDEGLLSRTRDGTYWRSGGSTFLPALTRSGSLSRTLPDTPEPAVHGPKKATCRDK
jgi:hypothetical protein